MHSAPVGQEGNLISRHLDLFTKANQVSTPTWRGKGHHEAAIVLRAGIIQIKFERYNLRTSRQ
jgi:hypothetical protein